MIYTRIDFSCDLDFIAYPLGWFFLVGPVSSSAIISQRGATWSASGARSCAASRCVGVDSYTCRKQSANKKTSALRFCQPSGEVLQHLERSFPDISPYQLDIFGLNLDQVTLASQFWAPFLVHHGRSLLEPLVDGAPIYLEPCFLDSTRLSLVFFGLSTSPTQLPIATMIINDYY